MLCLRTQKNYQPKYWVYEMFLEELIIILSEVWGLDDFYIVSKKYEWLITECHEDMVSLCRKWAGRCARKWKNYYIKCDKEGQAMVYAEKGKGTGKFYCFL